MSCVDRNRPRILAALAALLVLLIADLAFVVLHVVARASEAPDAMHHLDYGGSYAAWLRHAKEAAIMLGLAMVAWQTRTLVYGAWAVLFGYLLLDDHLGVHERAGLLLSESLDIPATFRLRPQDYGELAISLVAGALLLGTVLATHVWAAAAHRVASARLLALLLLLVFFGAGVDLLHVIVGELPLTGLTVLRDGGEMVVMSLIFTFVAWQAATGTAPGQNSATVPQEEWARRSGR